MSDGVGKRKKQTRARVMIVIVVTHVRMVCARDGDDEE